jgi:hypothetical protein
MTLKAQQIRQQLGFDPTEPLPFRTIGTTTPATTPTFGIIAETEQALAIINSSPYVKQPLSSDEVYVHTIEAGSTRFIADRFAFLSDSTLRNIANDASAGFAFMTRHNKGGLLGAGENPYGRTFAGQVEQKDGIRRVLVQFYMLRDHTPNGSGATSTDDLHRGLVGGTLFDASLGLTRGGSGRLNCTVCGLWLLSDDCPHIPGSTSGMSDEQIAMQASRGVPGGVATMTFENYHAGEVSVVYDGAIPNAGTAFSTLNASIETAPKGCTEERTSMYSKELRIKLGLAESATDAEVDAKLAQLQSSSARAAQLEDESFIAKYTGKLSATTLDAIKGLPNRDTLAQSLVAELAKQIAPKPPVGDPLRGTSGAAAQDQYNTAGPTPESELWREGLGVFTSEETLVKAVLVRPMDALGKCLGIKFSLSPTHKQYDDMAIVSRKAAYGIA